MDCKHENKTFRKFAFEVKGERRYHKACQCLDCGERIKSLSGGIWWPLDHKEKVEELPDFDLALLAERVDGKQAIKREEYKSERLQKHEEYEKYIFESSEWRARRNKILLRCNGICEACLTNGATQIHHINYNSLFCEVLYDLRGVCSVCHKKIHGII